MRKRAAIPSVVGAGLLLATAALADPYNPAERAIGGGLRGPAPGRPSAPSQARGPWGWYRRRGGRRVGSNSRCGDYTGATAARVPPPLI